MGSSGDQAACPGRPVCVQDTAEHIARGLLAGAACVVGLSGWGTVACRGSGKEGQVEGRAGADMIPGRAGGAGKPRCPQARGQGLRVPGGEEGWGRRGGRPETHQAWETRVSVTKGQVAVATLTSTAWPIHLCPHAPILQGSILPCVTESKSGQRGRFGGPPRSEEAGWEADPLQGATSWVAGSIPGRLWSKPMAGNMVGRMTSGPSLPTAGLGPWEPRGLSPGHRVLPQTPT